MELKYIIKRNGKREDFNIEKLRAGVSAAFAKAAAPTSMHQRLVDETLQLIDTHIKDLGYSCITAEKAQTIVCDALKEVSKFEDPDWGLVAYDCFIDYARKRKEARDMRALKKTLSKLTTESSADMDLKRENANINADTAMGTMLRYGSESAKSLALSEMMSEHIATAHKEGDIHIHDLDFWNLTETCCQINLLKLFKGGFSTGHGVLREPGNILSAASLACIAIQSNQNDQHGGQSVPCFDFYLAPYVTKTCLKHLMNQFADWFDDEGCKNSQALLKEIKKQLEAYVAEGKSLLLADDLVGLYRTIETVIAPYITEALPQRIVKVFSRAQRYTEADTHQAMEALVHNLNTMNSRAG